MSEEKKQAAHPDSQSAGILRGNWFEGRNRELVLYYLIAVAFLELIVGAVAFFYGVVHATPLVEGGPRMANFPWVGWLIAAVLSPVGLLLLLHLSGNFFSRSLNGGTHAAGEAGGSAEGVVPERVERFYAVMRHAPTIVILLGLIALGAALFFLDSAMDVVRSVGVALVPYLPWILGCTAAFLIICYLGRLWFIARHNRMEREYEYRMRVLEKTGIVLAGQGCTPLRLQDGKLQAFELDPGQQAYLQAHALTQNAGQESTPKPSAEAEDVTDATFVECPEEGAPKDKAK